jgi:hypothetical protein
MTVPLTFGIFATIAVWLDWPMRLAIAAGTLGLLINGADLVSRRNARIEITDDHLRCFGLGLLRPPAMFRLSDIAYAAPYRTPFRFGAVPHVTALFVMPIPFGSCIGIRRKASLLDWIVWLIVRVEEPQRLLDALARAGVPTGRFSSSTM